LQIKGEAIDMDKKRERNAIFNKLPGFFKTGALVLILCAGTMFARLSTLAAVQQPAASDGKAAPTGKADAKKTLALPAPGTYKIDPAHSFAYFSAWHHLVGRVRGRFDKVTGTITVSPDPAECRVDVSIDVATISTQIGKRDEDLRSDAYFDVKKYLTMTYSGRGIHRVSGDLWRMDGSLTIHGVTRVVPLTFKYNGAFSDTGPNEPARVAFHGTAATKRAEFGIGARDNQAEVGNSTVPDVDIEIDVEADAASAIP
jgi:polyisoprenoid-binding protein YceI